MATSGETFDRSFIAASLDGDNFSSEPLFHLQNSCPDSSAFSVYDKPLHLPGGAFDSTDRRSVGEKLGPVSQAAFLSSRETDQSPDIRYIFRNPRERVGSVLDHLNGCGTLPLRQSDDRTNFVPSHDASCDARLSSRFNSGGAWNFASCHQPPRAVPSGESAHHSTDSFMHSNCFQPPQSSSPCMANEQKGILCDNSVNWPSFAVLDPLNRLSGCKGGVIGDRGHHFKKRASRKAVDTKVEDVFEPTRGDQPIVLTEGLNCKSFKVLHDSVQTVPSVQGNNDCASEAAVRRNCDPYHEDSYGFSNGSFEKRGISNGPKATSLETGYFDNVIASALENSSKSPPANVDKADSETMRKESSCKSTRKKTDADKRPAEQEPFFDPRRIFATSLKQTPKKACSKSEKPVIKTTECRQDLTNERNNITEFSSVRKTLTQVKTESVEENKDSVLNNQSPSQPHSGQSLDHHQFIRNDLSDDWKHKHTHTSTDAVRIPQHQKIEQQESNDSSRIPETVQKHVTEDKPSCRKVDNESTQNVEVKEDRKIANRLRKISSYLGRIDKGKIYNYLVWVLRETSLLIFNIVKLLIGVILHEMFAIMHYICWMAWQGIKWFYAVLKSKSSRTNDEERNQWDQASHANYLRRNRFLSENINLPESGDEAIHRLLSCEGKDPYSILGLKVDCADEEIRKYYRRQAFLVHPDKNHEPGAEEAFKILNHAFEMIGEPEKRQNYDSQAAVEQEDDTAKQQFSDLLTKLHETMQEAMQYMGCSVCGGKHKRIPVDILAREARYCSQCDLRHSAKEGDVWAETSRFGFVWHYYACMEGDIYDITSWASCQSEKFRHVPANSHSVLIHISTGHNRQNRTAARDAEAEFKDLLNSMYSSTAGRGSAAAGGPFGRGAYSPEGSSAGTSSGSKRRRRRRR